MNKKKEIKSMEAQTKPLTKKDFMEMFDMAFMDLADISGVCFMATIHNETIKKRRANVILNRVEKIRSAMTLIRGEFREKIQEEVD